MSRPVLKIFTTSLFVLTLLATTALGQQPAKNKDSDPITSGWKKVNEYIKKELPKSALTEVKKIYALAKKKNQDAQLMKSLLYMAGLQNEIRENNEDSSIYEMEKELAQSREPATSILNSILAHLYLDYYSNHRMELYRRTETVNFKKDDIATWSSEDFHQKISELYLRSIKDEKLLQQTKLESFEPIIEKGNVRHLRPTLFDFLAFRALVYFENNERDIKKPAYAFTIDQASAFDPAADFITRKFTTRDSSSLQHKALLIYQRLIAFHLKDAKPDALIDADLLRIEFVHDKSVHPDKEELYFNAVNHVAHQYETLPAAAQAWYRVAEIYNTAAEGYKPYGDSTHRLDKIKAKEICERVLTGKDSSEGLINCYNLLNEINSRSLQFSTEKVNIPRQAFRASVSYRNFGRLYLRIVAPDEKLRKDLDNRYDEKYWPTIINAKSLRSWEQALPLDNDLQNHNVEIKIDALPAGEYLLVASTDKDFNDKKTILGARYFYVSSISFINAMNNFFVLNRDNGQPLAGASVQLWERNYDYKQSKYVSQKGKLYKTDANGFFQIENKKDNNYLNVYLDVTYNNDHLFLDDQSSYYYYNQTTPPSLTREQQIEANTYTHIFSDRSIYRPGQTIFFKGISIVSDKNPTRTVRNDYKTRIYLINANYQKIDSLEVQTNEYGSFSGKFSLPQGVLNGRFMLQMQSGRGSVDFRVEEYKRPKFYVEYEKIKGTYRVNDKIKVTAKAKAYAGNNIDGATVTYRVVRQPRLMYAWSSWKSWLPRIEGMEIAHGETKTDKEGKFNVEFTAIPDLTVAKKFDPVFDYTVYADVTDINGETRSGTKIVSVSYKALLLKVDLDESMPVDSLNNISIRTENTNGEFEPSKVTVSITRLKPENRLVRTRYWERPDKFIMTKEEYTRNFPNDEYDNETSQESWEKGNKVFEQADSVTENSKFKIQNPQFGEGFYKVEIFTKDKNGEDVRDVRYIELYDDKSNRLGHPQYLWTKSAEPIEPGEKTSVKLGSSAENLFIVQETKRQTGNQEQETGNFSFTRLSDEKRTFDFTATESDRGGYGVSYFFVKNNRFYQFQQTIAVPWTNKDLQIEYASYRDKTLPGSEEKWKIKLKGYKNEKVAAEILASMYDASLDQFYPHSWYKPPVWPMYGTPPSWSGQQNFQQGTANMRYVESDNQKYFDKQYDEMIFQQDMDVFQHDMNPDVRYKQRAVSLASPRFNAKGDVLTYAFAASEKREINKEGSWKDVGNYLTVDSVGIPGQETDQIAGVQVRKNFNETAFFFPDLRTDSSGAIEFSFTIPEALTRWKFQAMAHTKELAFGYSSKEIVTQKQLMVQPNTPRFLREGDKMEFSAKIVNLTDKEITGQATFRLFDAASNEALDGYLKNVIPNQYFTVAAGQSEAIKFPIEVPDHFNKALTWQIVAKAGDISDGEEDALPVLSNRMLVTETLPLNMRGGGTKNFKFDKLLNSGNSETLQNYSLTVEYTSNPVWLAVQALPYLMEYPYECAEQTWNRYYANSLASMIANSSPRIKQIFEQWKMQDTSALLSNLQKNQELKSVLLEETPWVLQAKTEAEQKKNIALLFDLVKMSGELTGNYEKLRQMQSSNGGFVWFKGGPDDRYITQYIVTGIGHLRKLKAVSNNQSGKLDVILSTALPYLDRKIKEDYDILVKSKTDLKKYTPGTTTIQYLYMRSFFPEQKIAAASQTAYTYFRSRAQKTWTSQSKYMQGMLVLALSRTGDAVTPAAILRSLKETSINNEELGRYWKDVNRGWWWYEAPVERQSLMIEAFYEVGKDTKTADDLKTWLLKNKQTNKWESTKATAEACYALLLQGSQWMNSESNVQVQLGDISIAPGNAVEAGTGYFKKTIEGDRVTPQMGNITVSLTPVPLQGDLGGGGWGGVYWQYFEDLDKITTASTPLNLVKKLFVEKNTDRGPVLTPVNNGDELKVGDKIKVRIELRVDRDMEYVHMKDMRAAAMEPVNVLSNYKWQGGLGYYETTKDASTNFFFSSLRKGTYVFEYPLFVTHSGNFSNGITTIQCMYAPEFSSHSEGIRINVE